MVPFSRLQTEALDSYGAKEAYNLIMAYDGLVYWLGQKGNIQFEIGGQPDFRERVLYGFNTNIDFRGKNTQIPTVDDDGFTLASVPQRVVDGAIVWNQIELDQVRGNPAIAPGLIEDKIRQFNTTWVRKIANKLRQATPGASDPYTLLPSGTTGVVNGILIARTPAQQVTDAATTAGIQRSEVTTLDSETVRWWANQYSNTSMDLTTVAGRASLYEELYAACQRGSAAQLEPDFGLCGAPVLASLGASADNNRRGSIADGDTAKFGYDNIKFYNAVLIRDSHSRFLTSATVGKLALLNSNALKLKVVQGSGGVSKEMLDEENNLKSLPIYWKHKNMSDWDSLNYNTVGYLNTNLVPRGLSDHGLADNLT